MEFLLQQRLVLEDDMFDIPKVVAGNPPIAGENYWIEPELALTGGRAHMDVRRLRPLIRVEMEPVRSDTQDGRHGESD